MSQSDWDTLSGAALAHQLSTQTGTLQVVVLPNVASAVSLYKALKFFAPADLPILTFPDWETLPYDSFSPHADLVSMRIKTLTQLPSLTQGILVVACQSLLGRLAPRTYIAQHSFCVAVGEQYDLMQLREQLVGYGYAVTEQVSEPGQLSLRGSLLDVYPSGSPAPLRIEFFDQEIEQIRHFDPESQLTTDTVTEVTILPAHEFPLNQAGVEHFREQWRQHFSGNPSESAIYQQISQQQHAQGVEYYLPLFFEQTASLFDYLPDNSCFYYHHEVETQLNAFWQEVQQRYQQRAGLPHHPALPPESLYLNPAECLTHTGQPFAKHAPAKSPINNLNDVQPYLESGPNRVLITVASPGRLSALQAQCKQLGLAPETAENWADFLQHNAPLMLCTAPIQQGFYADNLAVVCEHSFSGTRIDTVYHKRQQAPRHAPGISIQQFSDLHAGDVVVHETHGIGQFVGLKTLNSQGLNQEFMTIEYANHDKLYVPIHDLDKITRYISPGGGESQLTRLGSGNWHKARQKALKRAFDTAAELLEVYAKREAKPGFCYPQPGADYQKFAASFAFEETPDQLSAIEDVITDMTSTKSMDRLVCGDVGFGKTEVAMRAAFLAVHANKQVAVLVPTTLLATQHVQSFKDRFAGWPVNITGLSRLVEGGETSKTLKKLADGGVDIIIGTHKLLQKGIQFKDLGLLIVDEEQRFGVTHKEQVKAMRANVDILTLTATPIPRTLHFAMSSLRDLSLITTPPARRLAVKTFVKQFDPVIIKEAIQRELRRGGQVFFLHNQVRDIDEFSDNIKKLLPEVSFRIAHGQMQKRQLEHTMLEFYHQEFQVLICTTIIESGIDIPTANTILIDRADKLGLAQLHQLRGRVGRSHHQAYAYLLTPEAVYLSKDALLRLDAISQANSLGAGFNLAMHDLEIRGAGELLGSQQSGHMQAVGYDCYINMLKQAVKSLKAGKILHTDASSLQLPTGTEIDCGLSSRIPDDYLQDIQIRLGFYKRIANAKQADDFEHIRYELSNRFGPLPADIDNLLQITQLRNWIEPLGIEKLLARQGEASITLAETNQIDQKQLITLLQTRPKSYRLKPPNQLYLSFAEENPSQRLPAIHALLARLFAAGSPSA